MAHSGVRSRCFVITRGSGWGFGLMGGGVREEITDNFRLHHRDCVLFWRSSLLANGFFFLGRGDRVHHTSYSCCYSSCHHVRTRRDYSRAT